MILTVHDELLFEAPKAAADETAALVRERMEGAVALRVPLTVDVGRGRELERGEPMPSDVTQDALLTVLTSLHKYTPRVDARFAAWVTTIAVNTARRRFRRRRPALTATGELPETPDDTADPADDLDRARQRRALLIALGELPERERAIVSLRYGAERNASENRGHPRPRARDDPQDSRAGAHARSARASRHC